ncbi:TadE/TadG family type IV pilus assembly protein [Rhizorhabdus dicambivorans]|uniref:TadE family protein n=1 Tax=Rhizorhabdus dicambivorans TaxID=1850238 RepID=A0A2A4G190_9SPHN|nr:TadE/TadG family type IV pilus assembly protein [Rhizorhabdus dicambivorans]ATE66752.1 TadE family protein [Rhizorhabdus dicambivorans]PCE43761.1 TadE family protein [Rhizorhabdus dicambivorans]
MRKLLRDRRGVTATEFALVAPAFMMFLFLIIDGARAAWTYQTLQSVATDAARCAALGVSTCDSSAEVKTYAVNRANGFGVPLTAAAVTLTTSATCQSMAGMTKVAISTSYQGATTKLLPSPITTLSTESCFPTAS